MKLQRSPRLTESEVNMMFADQENQLAHQLSALFAHNQLLNEEQG
jgi:hypothetical protein